MAAARRSRLRHLSLLSAACAASAEVSRKRIKANVPVVDVRQLAGVAGHRCRRSLLVLGSLEFVGRFEEHGWKLAGTMVPVAYTAWSPWLVATGAALLI